MSYDIRISVKVEGCDKYAVISTPKYDTPTYNLGQMFRACMDWNFSQSEEDETGEYKTCYYSCDFAVEKASQGVMNLISNREAYRKYEPENRFGTVEQAITVLRSLRDCILDLAEEYPLSCLYMSW